MNKIKSYSLLLLLACSITFAQAQKPVAKDKALNFLLKTNRLIGHAHMSVKMGKVYNGSLGNAVRHERYAKSLYLKGMYSQAIHHSKRARLLALDAIKSNKVKPTSDAIITAQETELLETVPSDQELDDALAAEKAEEIQDQEIIKNNKLDLEIK